MSWIILGYVLKVEITGYSSIEYGYKRRGLNNESEVVGLNNLKDQIDISYN